MQWLVGLLLSGPFLESRSLASQPQLDYFLVLIIVGAFAAYLDDPLHVASLCPDKPPRNLELLVILNLNIKTTRVFNIFILCLLEVRLLLLLR
jgi:hypothetical protein